MYLHRREWAPREIAVHPVPGLVRLLRSAVKPLPPDADGVPPETAELPSVRGNAKILEVTRALPAPDPEDGREEHHLTELPVLFGKGEMPILPAPLRHGLQAPSQSRCCGPLAHDPSAIARASPVVREAEPVERLRLAGGVLPL